jgi:hypothetical protein
MKSTTFILSTLLVAQALFFMDARGITATTPNNYTHSQSSQQVAILASQPSGLNEECKSLPPAQDPDENWNMEKTFDFSDRGKSYKLVYSWKLPDSTSLCLLEGKTARPIVLKEGAYIDKVERVRVKLFNVQIHEGNGNNVPATKYQLNLGQPQQPKIKVLKRWVLK